MQRKSLSLNLVRLIVRLLFKQKLTEPHLRKIIVMHYFAVILSLYLCLKLYKFSQNSQSDIIRKLSILPKFL